MSEEIKHFSCALSTVLGCVTSSLEHTEDPGTGNVMQFLRGKSFSKLLLVQAPYLLCFFQSLCILDTHSLLAKYAKSPFLQGGLFPPRHRRLAQDGSADRSAVSSGAQVMTRAPRPLQTSTASGPRGATCTWQFCH